MTRVDLSCRHLSCSFYDSVALLNLIADVALNLKRYLKGFRVVVMSMHACGIELIVLADRRLGHSGQQPSWKSEAHEYSIDMPPLARIDTNGSLPAVSRRNKYIKDPGLDPVIAMQRLRKARGLDVDAQKRSVSGISCVPPTSNFGLPTPPPLSPSFASAASAFSHILRSAYPLDCWT